LVVMDVLTAEPNYVYKPLDSAGAEIRLLKVVFDVKQVLGRVNVDPLIGSLKHYYLPISTLSRTQRMVRSAQLPAFNALSYVWGDPARTHEITIDNKRLGITENLYKALRDLQRDAVGDTYVWADAICICQDDLAERSAQILLMREIYYSAAYVNIWLGSPTEEGRKCFKFIADLTGRIGPDPEVTEDSKFEEYFMKGVLTPTSAVVRAGIGFGQTIFEIGDIIHPGARDDMAEMILDPDANLSLHHDTIQKLVDWSPHSRHLKRVQDRNFVEIANLIDQTLIENCHWFERMWVVQEVGCSDSPAILFAGCSVFWKDFLHAIYYLHHHLSAPVSSIRKVTGLEKIRQGWVDGKRQPLRDLLRECRYRRATDPRDKIFSLLGMMGDKLSTYLIPDYSKSVSEVYANVAFHFIEQSQSLDPICGWQTLGRQEQLPTWTPDYNLNQDAASSPLVPIDGRESIFCASGSDYRSKYTGLDAPKKDNFWRSLRTYGVYIDSVAMLSDPLPEDEPFGSMEHFWQSTISASRSLLEGFTQDVQSHLENISLVVSKYSEYWNSIEHTSKYLRSLGGMSKHSQITDRLSKHSQSIENLSRTSNLSDNGSHFFDPIKPDPFIHEIYILDAYIQSLLCGRISTRERLTREEINKFMSPNPPDTTDPVRESFLTKACNALEAGMIGRSIAVTKHGYIGAIPQDAQTGDLICVLFGCSVPVVMRKRAGEEYIFIGECYLHGFMDAEAIAMQAKGNLQVQGFVLC
jgi:hypothetical protein